ncbi:uncharacterized protein MYCFIDRAFT_79056 [Pseudocercospora fijiensis CIRAD86]|uniref:Uncharacterized protein n=1 Tax=Pseudocercospora fijiensis (strain CIRAD86) TaxID=383855 RepID=M3A069_PSEFD|nr:uncharacterized protein MYCFIDRAFT_79056 [Pseudocercospora fijiensis CIRAD86]EME77791.1 hypothetical protein MYCFIDRAFT_79056 [Pseudocercospora fijiensis CIRAD86]
MMTAFGALAATAAAAAAAAPAITERAAGDTFLVIKEALVESTIYSTEWTTVEACAPSVSDCPENSVTLVTSIVHASTTVCPVTQTETSTVGGPVTTSLPTVSSVYPSSSDGYDLPPHPSSAASASSTLDSPQTGSESHAGGVSSTLGSPETGSQSQVTVTSTSHVTSTLTMPHPTFSFSFSQQTTSLPTPYTMSNATYPGWTQSTIASGTGTGTGGGSGSPSQNTTVPTTPVPTESVVPYQGGATNVGVSVSILAIGVALCMLV